MHAKRDNQKAGEALTDFHKVKFIFVGEDANNTSNCTSLLGDFIVVVIAFEIWIISDLSYNCISKSQSRSRSAKKQSMRQHCHIRHPAKYEHSR